jgi:hypothetical protein
MEVVTKNFVKKNGIATHQKFHIDEGVGVFCLLKEGHRINVSFENGLTFAGNSIFERDPNTLYLGIGGGPYDEHSLDGDNSKMKESSISLLAKDLDIKKGSPLFNMVSYAHINDTQGSKNMFELGAIVKEMFRQNYNEKNVWLIIQTILERKYQIENNRKDFKFLAKKMRGPVLSKTGKFIELNKFNLNRKVSVNNIVLSKKFTISDMIAVLLLRRFGFSEFGVSKDTPIKFVDIETYGHKNEDLCIGLNRGIFSTLPAQKISKVCNVYLDGEYSLLTNYSDNIESRSGYNSFFLEGLITDAHLTDEDPEDTFLFFEKMLMLFIQKQRKYINACKFIRTCLNNGKITSLPIKGKMGNLKIAVLSSDRTDLINPLFTEYNYQIIISQNLKGQVAILSKDNKINLRDIMVELQKKELNLDPTDIDPRVEELLGKPGSLSICPQWFLQEKWNSSVLLNGGHTHSLVEPTCVLLGDIKTIVETAVLNYLND